MNSTNATPARGNDKQAPEYPDLSVREIQAQTTIRLQRWGNYKQARSNSGLSIRLLQDYVKDGLIRSSVVTKPGSRRGVRLIDLHSLDALIEAGVGKPPIILAMNLNRGKADK